MHHNPNPLVEVTTDSEVAHQLIKVSHQVAGRYQDRFEQDWRDHLYEVMATHPSVEIRGATAAGCSLGLLRQFAADPDPYVRWSATKNRFAIDADVQEILAADPDGRVVLGLIHFLDPGVGAIRIIIASHHSDAKQILAGRGLRTELIQELAGDRDPTVRAIARRNLAHRVGRGPVRLELKAAS